MTTTIRVTLREGGGLNWITQNFGVYDWKMNPMIIPDCARCVAVYIFWKTIDNDVPLYSVTGVHVPPYNGKSIKKIKRFFFKRLLKKQRLMQPYFIAIAGGQINTIQNQIDYYRALKNFVRPFLYIFPNVQTGVHPPSKVENLTSFILNEDGTLSLSIRELLFS